MLFAVPPDDAGWLCPGCDCKVDCIDMLKDFQGANLDIDDGWEVCLFIVMHHSFYILILATNYTLSSLCAEDLS